MRCGDLPGMCGRSCPGHPTNTGFCSACAPGPCRTPLVCEMPLAELTPIRRRLFTQRRFAFSPVFLVGALFAVPGVVLFAIEGLRYFTR